MFNTFTPEFYTLTPIKMQALASSMGQNEHRLAQFGAASSFPPKSIEQILDYIKRNETEKVSLLEWLFLIQNKAEWDQLNGARAQESAQSIWQVACHTPLLKRRLLWRLALKADDKKYSIAPSLSNEFDNNTQRYLAGESSLCQQVLKALVGTNPAQNLAKIMLENMIPPQELSRKAELPPHLTVTNNARAYLPEAFAYLYLGSQEPLKAPSIAERYLLKEMADQPREIAIKFTEKLILKIPSKQAIDFKALYQGVLDRFAPKAKNSLWEQLSAPAQEALSHWLSVAHYRDFEAITELLTSNKNRVISDEKEVIRLKSRSSFWSDYQTRFISLHILLPQKTHDALSNKLKKLRTEQVSVLKHDNADNAEICIFELENAYIAEVFRGGSGETRFIPKSSVSKKVLAQTALSLKDLRAIETSEAHDHVYLWQHYADKWLRTRGIARDIHAKRKFNERPPSKEKQAERESALINWRSIMDRLEAEARVTTKNLTYDINLVRDNVTGTKLEKIFYKNTPVPAKNKKTYPVRTSIGLDNVIQSVKIILVKNTDIRRNIENYHPLATFIISGHQLKKNVSKGDEIEIVFNITDHKTLIIEATFLKNQETVSKTFVIPNA